MLTWHVSMVAANGTLLLDHHATLTRWAVEQNIALPPIGHNEMLGPGETLDPAANVAFLAALEELQVDHACRACWTDKTTGQSPCLDNTIDGLLTDDCTDGSGGHGLHPECEALQPRAVYYPNLWYAEAVGLPAATVSPSIGCGGNAAGFATVSTPDVAVGGGHGNGSGVVGGGDAVITNSSASVVFGRFVGAGVQPVSNVTIEFRAGVPSNSTQCSVTVEHVVGSSNATVARTAVAPPVPANLGSVPVSASGSVSVTLRDIPLHNAYRVTVAGCIHT